MRIASLAQMGAGLGRLSNASLKIKQNRIVAYASCGFVASDMYWTDELAYQPVDEVEDAILRYFMLRAATNRSAICSRLEATDRLYQRAVMAPNSSAARRRSAATAQFSVVHWKPRPHARSRRVAFTSPPERDWCF